MQVTNDSKFSDNEAISLLIGIAVWFFFSFWWGLIAFAVALSYFKENSKERSED